jgi:hypothetical protein
MAGIAALADKNDIEIADPATSPGKTSWYFRLTMRVFVAAVIGIALGHYYPQIGDGRCAHCFPDHRLRSYDGGRP